MSLGEMVDEHSASLEPEPTLVTFEPVPVEIVGLLFDRFFSRRKAGAVHQSYGRAFQRRGPEAAVLVKLLDVFTHLVLHKKTVRPLYRIPAYDC